MVKTRSSRRMRNCKSRTKRVGGGMFGDGSCFDCSIIKRKFKKYYYNKAHKLCPYVNSLSGAKINALYRELNDKDEQQTERRVLINCIAQNYMHDVASIPADIESTIRSAIDAEIQLARQKEAYRQNALIADQKAAEVAQIRKKYYELHPELKQQSVILSTGSEDSTPVDDDDDDVLPKFIIPREQMGGKSRRRHRRGRTLHKRRKSSKVRKTRRTHSRS